MRTETEIREGIRWLESERTGNVQKATKPATPHDILQGWRRADEATAKIHALRWALGDEERLAD